MKKILSFLIILIVGFSFGQYGWTKCDILLKNGTKLSGEAWIPQAQSAMTIAKWKEKVKFRKAKKQKKQKYAANEVEYIIFHTEDEGDVKFVPVKLKARNKNAVFMQELAVGDHAKLYARMVSLNRTTPMYGPSAGPGSPMMITHYQYTFGSLNEFWVDKIGEKKMSNIVNGKIRFKSYKKRLLEVFGDCPSLVSSIEGKEYMREDLPALVDAYNLCMK